MGEARGDAPSQNSTITCGPCLPYQPYHTKHAMPYHAMPYHTIMLRFGEGSRAERYRRGCSCCSTIYTQDTQHTQHTQHTQACTHAHARAHVYACPGDAANVTWANYLDCDCGCALHLASSNACIARCTLVRWSTTTSAALWWLCANQCCTMLHCAALCCAVPKLLLA